jgi:hypothetical protein
MRPSDRITLFLRNASTLPFDVRALNMLPEIGQSSAPMTEGWALVRILAALLSHYHN